MMFLPAQVTGVTMMFLPAPVTGVTMLFLPALVTGVTVMFHCPAKRRSGEDESLPTKEKKAADGRLNCQTVVVQVPFFPSTSP